LLDNIASGLSKDLSLNLRDLDALYQKLERKESTENSNSANFAFFKSQLLELVHKIQKNFENTIIFSNESFSKIQAEISTCNEKSAQV
jgi:hypothetical protein